MHMKNHLYRILSCALLLLASTTSVLAENGIRETLYYTICPGETIRLESERVVVITKSTILYDTMHVTNPNEDSITAYVVTLYPSFEKDEYKRLQKGESYTWQDTTISDPGVYERIYHSQHECDSIHRLHVTQQIDSAITFTLCDDENVSFNGRTYSNAGVYTDILSGDTVYTITIVKHPSREFVQYGVLDRTHPYYWQYTLDGEQKTDTIYEPGRYVYTSQNPETGCNDRWILILTKDETTFHSIETVTICESEDFNWRNHQGMNKLGVGQTIHYYDRYRTEADQDSIYELILTVKPTLRSTRTIPFCGSIEWNGKMYTESTTIVDSLKSVQFSCDSIVTTILVKGTPVTHRDTISILGGETLMWHGRPITQAGDYTDIHNSVYGCDTTFYLHVDVKEPAHVMNTHSEWYSICQGDGQLWRGNTYYNSGIYYDTIKTANEEIDSLYILYLTVNPTYAWSERISFLSFPTTYRDSLINQPGAYVFKYQSTFGCDSIITTYIDQDVYRDEQTVTICPGETHIWSYDGQTYTVSGKYTKVEQNAAGHDSVIHVLNLTVRYIPETHIEHTMCKGETYIFADQSLTQSGVYRHTYHKTGGCDSVVVLSLNVLSPDTTYLAIQRPQGESYVWDGETIRQPGMYFHYGTNRFGCDSVSILQFTYNQVDTVSATLTVCPNELPFEWNGISANQTNRYTRLVQEANGNYTYYVLDLTVREVAQRDTTLSICEGGSITFNGVTYDEAGHYRTYLTCDTLINVHIVVNQPVVYETHGTITDDHGFTWQYIDHGTPGEQEFKVAGTYEYENPNPTTGCNDIYRLILTKDETSYHFEESLTICEGDDFTWHGLANLSSITGTNTYTDKYETRAGKDSIYTLHLTVTPVERTVRTIVFCDETSWNGKTYTESTVVYDTISLPTGCYRIERINLDKEATFYQKEYKELPQGTVLHWHGQNITTDGTYYDYGMTVNGCDSTYEITVKIIPATPQTNQYAVELSTCEGDTIIWRGKDIWRSGVYVDTVYAAGTNNIDSIFSLTFTAWPAPKDTIIQHLYTCSDGAAIRYNGQDYYTDQVVVTNFKTIHNCDSIVKVFLHFNTALSLSRTDTITDLQLPHTWTYQLYDYTRRDTVLTKSGTYTHTVASEGGCTNQETLTLVVLKTYLFELDTTICETDLPLLWRGQYLQHPIGQTKQYEDVLKTVHNTDSIYRINLTIDPAPKRVERIAICENKDTIINGKSYFDPVLYPVGLVFRDTMYKDNGANECDSIIYYEITKTPQRHITETRILHVGESFEWHEMTISDPVTKTYTLEDEIDPNTGCEIIYQIRVIAEERITETLCSTELPYTWDQTGEDYNVTGLFTDTIYNAEGFITEFHSLDLTVTQPYDTTVYVHGCDNTGAHWHDQIYWKDTTFVENVPVQPYNPSSPCDSIFHVNIIIDKTYYTYIDTTLCEYQLPLIIGRVNPDTIWEERNFRHPYDTTKCGCDSIIEGHLTIIPKLDKNDSTFICEGEAVTLGDLVHPTFLDYGGGYWEGKWEGKWHGVDYTEDTIVWDCDHRYFHHIIRRPSQKVIPEDTIYLCHDDSLQLFWPYDTTWFYHDTVYEEHRPMNSTWTDPVHGITYKNDSYTCDSVTRWFIKKLPLVHKDTTAHKLLGDSIWWGGNWRYYTGIYDSIAPSTDTNSYGKTCTYLYHLHLIVDTAYLFKDTVTICTPKQKSWKYTWPETGHVQEYTVGTTDTMYRHYYDSLITYDRRDSVYDLCVNYSIIRDTLIFDTICEDTRYRFDSHRGTVERWVDKAGRYVDTLTALNGCDSIVTLQLFVRPRVVTTPQEAMITDREIPYLWKHSWMEDGQRTELTDTLRATGLYTFRMPSIHGCDSIDSLYLTVHQTHVFRDTINVCDGLNQSRKHTWYTGYIQEYNTPLMDDTAFYADTLETRIKYDSIYVLCVNFHQTYETLVRDTICEGERYRFDLHQGTQTTERWFEKAGTYYDTVESHYGCDSVIVLKLFVRNRIPVTHPIVHIPDTAAPYLWYHKWSTGDSTQILSASGEYEFRMTNIYGCDSIDSLSLFIHKTYRIQEDSITICYDQTPYTWQDRNDITKTSDLVFHALTHDGYDSIRYVHIEVLPLMKTVIRDTLCDGDSLQFGLTKANEIRFVHRTGVYYDTLTSNRYGCDSIIELRLNVFDKYFNEHTKHISVADTPYVWEHVQDGVVIASDTLHLSGGQTEGYTYTFTSTHGCDSIDSLTLHVHQTYLYRDSVVICSDETPYSWEGITDIYTTNEYIKNLRTHDGYDSIHVRYVEVLPVLHSLLTNTICEGDSLRFGLSKMNKERFLTDAGVYYDTLTSYQYGCDSIIELRLNVYPKHRNHQTVDIADTQLPYLWEHIQGGQTIGSEVLNGAGEYSYHFTTEFGCDSIDSLSLRVHRTYLIVEDTIQLCSDEIPYTWCSYTNITETNDYIYYGQTADGYDSIRTVHINVWPVKYTTLEGAICEGHSYKFNGKDYTEQGTYYDTLTTTHGCDSIVTLHLTVHQPYFNTRTEHIFEGQQVAFFDTICSTTGTYFHFGATPQGCDSTTVLQLFVHKLVDTTVTVCSYDLPYIWTNKWDGTQTPLYTAGIYRNDTSYVDGERMFYGLQLVVNEPTNETIYREICEGNTYNFNGQQLATAGEYRDTLRNAVGCDSVVILHLNVLPKYYHTVERTIYEGDTVHFMDQIYSTSGVYPVRFTSSIGCDSIIELRLTVTRLYDDSVSVCANDLPLMWRGQTIYESGIYRDTVSSTNGTSVVGIKVTVLPIAHLEEPIMKTICEGDFYKFGDSILTTQGTYYDTLTAANGCDSIVTLVLQVQPTEYKSEVRRIFEGDSVLFDGVWYKESGVYERRETNSYGCTDTYQLILTVLKSFNIDTMAVVCNNELPFIWRGYEYNESGDYSLPIAWTDSSRVVKTLHLTVNHTFYMEQNISLCSGDTFLFNGKQYFESGFFYDTVPSLVGCDSVTKYILSVHPSVDKIIEKHISDKQPYNFHGRDLTLTGTYEWTGKTIHGCDSIEHLYLTVHPSFFQSDTLDLCQSDSLNYPYVWQDPNGRIIATISQSGTYSDSVLTEYGFDSVHQLVVYVHPSYFIREQYEIGVGEHLKIHGRDISQPAIYYDTLRTIHGCDSIFHVVVNQKRTREWTWDREICQGEFFDFFGRRLTHTGQYKYTSQYKDSVITLNLTVNPISITETRKVITDKQIPYIYNGRIYEQGGIYNDTLVNRYGCDSILRFVLIVSSRYSDWTPMPLCPGSEIKIDGESITEAGLYTFLRRSRVTGEMDSIWRVEIYDAPAFEFADTISLCEGDTIFYGNVPITHGGNQDIKLKTVEGCDSIYHLNVTVYPSYSFDTTVTIFDYQTFTWEQNHQNYTVEGTYTKTFPTKKDPFHTCDSTYVLNLKVIPTTRHSMEYTICDGQEYTWRGKTYSKEGFYYDTVANLATFVSSIYSLHLMVSYPTYIKSATATPICADDKTYSIAFEYDGAKPTLYSIYYDQRAKDEGFKDVINKPFLGEDQFAIDSVPTKTDVIYLEHTAFIKPNKYYLSLVLDNGVCGQSRADNIELSVKYPNWIIEQNWNDIVVPLKKELNGGYEFSQADWIVNGVRQLNNGRGYLQYNFRDGDEVVMIATRKGENYAIETCPLVISINPNMAYDDPILIYPTQAPKQMPRIHIEAPKDGTYEVYGSTGTLLFSGNFTEGETEVTLPAINGIYFIRTMAQGAEPETHKVIIY